MGRPTGYRLDRQALDDLLVETRVSMTEAALLCGMPLTTLSSLATGDRRASMKTVRAVAIGLACDPERLFPELRSRSTEVTP